MEHMTEQIKSIIQTLNASQVMVQHSMILVFLLSSFNNYQFTFDYFREEDLMHLMG